VLQRHYTVSSSVKKVPVNPTKKLLIPQSEAKFNKPVSSLPLHVDFPRLFHVVNVIDKDGNKIWESKSLPKVNQMLDFFLLLANNLNGNDMDNIRDKFYQYIPQDVDANNNDVPPKLKEYFKDVIGEESGIIGILKCINQDIIVPAVTILKFAFFMAKINYFEIRGKWDIDIQFTETNTIITNKRWERSSPEAFNFCWEVSFILNKEATKLENTELSISQIEYIKDQTDEQKDKYYKVMKNFIKQKD
jgi:hypothetical protein